MARKRKLILRLWWMACCLNASHEVDSAALSEYESSAGAAPEEEWPGTAGVAAAVAVTEEESRGDSWRAQEAE